MTCVTHMLGWMGTFALVAAASVYLVSATLLARRQLRETPHHYPHWRALWAIVRGLILGLIPAAVVGVVLGALL